MRVSLGHVGYEFPSDSLGVLEDHTELYLLEKWAELRQELDYHGYLRIRGLNERQAVLKARSGFRLFCF